MPPASPPRCDTLYSRIGHVFLSSPSHFYDARALSFQYTLFANASLYGTPPVRALFFEFPQEPELLSIDRQFMVGSDILVTPVVTPNVTSVSGEPSSLAV
jgi:hypothetical protein